MGQTRGISTASTDTGTRGITQTASGSEFTGTTSSGSGRSAIAAITARAVALLSGRAVALALAARAVALLSAVVRAGACLQRLGERERERESVCVRQSPKYIEK